ncbi:extracellular solute-binding protein [Agrobacterium tumefaciens]|uniref:extracellular solute-binding protein n=1 Tax=Agrobacterium tumefaciens TaxID=358 RepID=UPI0012B71379|nr:extracellular solute-binding protein [Agrobacterium tumefaciens]MQB08039.1 extracellular solute-binding protein [Agrobacterium tumefaciens]
MLKYLATASLALILGTASASALDLTVWAPIIYTPSSGFAPGAELHKKLYAEFEAKNPGVKIKYEVIDGSMTGLQAILTGASSGRVPNVAVVDHTWVPRLFASGLLQPLDDYWPAEDRADFRPEVIQDATIGGKLYGKMFQTGLRGVFYRESLVKQLGLAKFPETWEELEAAAPAMEGKGVSPMLLPARPNLEGNASHLLAMFWGLGGEVLDEKGAPVFFEGSNRKALETSFRLYADLATKYGMTREAATMDEGAIRPFLYSGEVLGIGQSASTIRQVWSEVPATKDDLRIASYPLPNGAKPVTVLGGFSYSILAADPKVREAAGRFVEFMTNAKNNGDINETMLVLPVRNSVWERPFFSGTPLMRQLRDLYLGAARTRPSSPLYPIISAAFTSRLSEVVAGSITPSEAVDRARDTVLTEYALQKSR